MDDDESNSSKTIFNLVLRLGTIKKKYVMIT